MSLFNLIKFHYYLYMLTETVSTLTHPLYVTCFMHLFRKRMRNDLAMVLNVLDRQHGYSIFPIRHSEYRSMQARIY